MGSPLSSPPRRRFVARIAAGMTSVVMLSVARTASAKAQKSEFAYQDRPHEAQRCASCRFFSPPEQGTSGTCAIVAGDISENGWCMAYSPKS